MNAIPKIKIQCQKDGTFIRVQPDTLPGCGVFYRRFVTINGEEYELVGSFYCDFMIELIRAGRPSIYACLATETESESKRGELEEILPEFVRPCGYAHICTHICAYRKEAVKLAMKFQPERKEELAAFLAKPDTITLNEAAIEYNRQQKGGYRP